MPFLLLMPSYNQAHYIRSAVDSILAQDDPDWELWIVDNSTDATPELLAQYRDPRIRFQHIRERMDPGVCLNWMLERAQGQHFSYVHTDNVLRPNYVRAMRAALATDPLALAYCDMRMIDAAGRRTGVSRRGHFDLARLLSLSPLGVPFSATTELARRLGGFSCNDVADDVLFCTRAYGLGSWTYLREPLLDYRHHSGSRTESVGFGQVQRSILSAFAKLLPELEARGLRPLAAMRQSLKEIAEDLRWAAEDRILHLQKFGVAWWGGDDHLDGLWRAGLVGLPGFSVADGAPGWSSLLATSRTRLRNAAVLLALRRHVRKRMNITLNARENAFRYSLPALARLLVGAGEVTWQAGSSDAMTLWGCKLLATVPEWKVALTRPAPRRIPWPMATETPQAWIDLSGRGTAPAGIPSIVI